MAGFDWSHPDLGLIAALRLPNLPRKGAAREYGFGTARNLKYAARTYRDAVGYEMNPDFVERAKADKSIKVQYANCLDVGIQRNSLAVAIASTAVFTPKGNFTRFLSRAWGGLKQGGIIHLDVATTRDGNLTSGFVRMTCAPFPEDGWPHSYHHRCYGCTPETHPGVTGASFWEESELDDFLCGLGPGRKIYGELREWDQDDWGDPIFRSFYVATWQKE